MTCFRVFLKLIEKPATAFYLWVWSCSVLMLMLMFRLYVYHQKVCLDIGIAGSTGQYVQQVQAAFTFYAMYDAYLDITTRSKVLSCTWLRITWPKTSTSCLPNLSWPQNLISKFLMGCLVFVDFQQFSCYDWAVSCLFLIKNALYGEHFTASIIKLEWIASRLINSL